MLKRKFIYLYINYDRLFENVCRCTLLKKMVVKIGRFTTCLSHVFYTDTLYMRHVTKNGKYDESSKKACTAVDYSEDGTVSEIK